LVGRSGQVSWELRRALQAFGEVIALGHSDLDLTKVQGIRETVRALKPAIIVNAAAYTAVDKAESDIAAATALNVDAPAVLAEEAARLGAFLLHYSTDYVFDGCSSTPYLESDATNPQSVYGRTKLAGEQAVAGSGVAHLILRTSWVYGRRGGNFLLTILRLARERDELSVVEDQFGAPTWSRTIAEATAQILSNPIIAAHANQADARLNRIYHLSAGGETNWYEFASSFLALAKQRGEQLALQRLLPIPASAYPTAAARPAFSLLSTAAIRADFGVFLPHWEAALELAMEEK